MDGGGELEAMAVEAIRIFGEADKGLYDSLRLVLPHTTINAIDGKCRSQQYQQLLWQLKEI